MEDGEQASIQSPASFQGGGQGRGILCCICVPAARPRLRDHMRVRERGREAAQGKKTIGDDNRWGMQPKIVEAAATKVRKCVRALIHRAKLVSELILLAAAQTYALQRRTTYENK